jgi:hypothetical protein
MSQENVEIVRAVFRDALNRDPRLDESWRDASEFYCEDFVSSPGWSRSVRP